MPSFPHSRVRRFAPAAAFGAVAVASLLIASAAMGGVRLFQSPSKNIGCAIVKYHHSGSARCDIGEHSWQAPPKPHSCDLDYGQGVQVGEHGKGSYVCAGDTVLNNGGPILAYGDSIKYAGIKCRSNTTGMRCHSLDSRHGFSLSRERVVFF